MVIDGTIAKEDLDRFQTSHPERQHVKEVPAEGEVTAMQKADIAKRIQQQVGISETEAATLLDWILALLKTTLQAGESITISGFGKFTVLSKRARQGRNPRTGEAVMISARRVVTFRPSLLLKTEMNSVPAERQGRVYDETVPT
jgi:integration host factor subunit alpha